jgi:hypothetical protein
MITHKDANPVPATAAGRLWRRPQERPGIKVVILPSVGDTPKKQKAKSGEPQFFILGGRR